MSETNQHIGQQSSDHSSTNISAKEDNTKEAANSSSVIDRDEEDFPAEEKMIEMIDSIFSRKTDILQLFQKKRKHAEKSYRTVLLFDDMETTLIQDCMSIEDLVRRMLAQCSDKRKHANDQHGTCAICRECLQGPRYKRVLGCGHEFHCVCIRQAFIKSGSRCPMCRHDFFRDYAKENMANTAFEEYEDKYVIGSITRFDV